MEQKLINFVNHCLGIAEDSGLASDNPVVLEIDTTTPEPNMVVLSYTEPTDLVLPLNVVWIVCDDTSPNYLEVFKRISKDANPPNIYTWGAVTIYDNLFTPEQYYAEEDKPVPVIIAASGGQLEEAVYARILESGMQYYDNELVPKAYVDAGDGYLRTYMLNLYSNMNNRVIYNDQRIRDLMTQTDTHTETIGELDNRVTDLESYAGSGVISVTHTQEDALDAWVIHHNFDAENVLIQVSDEDGLQIIPTEIHQASENVAVVLFDIPQIGKATVLKA